MLDLCVLLCYATLSPNQKTKRAHWRAGRANSLEQQLDKREDAEQLRQRMLLVMRMHCKAKGHPHTVESLRSMEDLANVFKEQGRREEAQELFRKVFKESHSHLGEDNPETLRRMNIWASVLEEQGEPEKAEQLHRDALQGLRLCLGKDHTETLSSMTNLGRFLHGQGKLKEAEELLSEALKGRQLALGEDHLDTFRSMSYLAAVLWKLGRKGEGVAHNLQAEDSEKKGQGCRTTPSPSPARLGGQVGGRSPRGPQIQVQPC